MSNTRINIGANSLSKTIFLLADLAQKKQIAPEITEMLYDAGRRQEHDERVQKRIEEGRNPS